MSDARFGFILGCQRSGTTLLRLVLEAHPDVVCLDEALAYGVLAGRKDLEAELAGRAPTRIVLKLPRFAEQMLEDHLVDDVYGRIPRFHDGQPGLFVTRDPRDVLRSMMTLSSSGDGESWVRRYAPGILEHLANAQPYFASLYGDRIARLRDAGFPELRTAATYWCVKNDALPRYLDAGLPVLPVAYEQLVAEPAPELERILAHFGLPWDPVVLRHDEIEHGQLEGDGLAIGGSDPGRPIDARSVGLHEGFFTAEQMADIEAITGPTWSRLQAIAR